MPRLYWAIAWAAALALFGLVVGGSSVVHAMDMCGRHDDFVAALNGKYAETRKAMAIAGQYALVEVFNSKAGTWTILATTPDGKTCIIGAGNAWQDLPPEISGEKS